MSKLNVILKFGKSTSNYAKYFIELFFLKLHQVSFKLFKHKPLISVN